MEGKKIQKPTGRRPGDKAPIPAPRTKKKKEKPRDKAPIPAPRVIMNLPVPKIEVPVLEPVKRPLRPSRIKAMLKKTAKAVTNWVDWLKNTGK